MDLIKRGIQDSVDGQTPPKAVVIFGARRIGKTTLLEQIVDRNTSAWYTGDSYSDIERLKLLSEGDVKTLLFQSDTLIIDEAQRIPDIGLLLKRLVDMNMTLDSPVRIFVTGSSSLELVKGIKESAVGRLVQRQMWPLSVTELAQAPKSSWAKVLRDLDWHLVYGMFPEVYNEPQKARILLKDYVDGILFKDLFSLGGIRLNSKFEVLVRLLAYSVGSEVSYDSLARETGLNKTTVADYITLLEQCFIVKVCPSYAKNLANELKKGKKVYFCEKSYEATKMIYKNLEKTRFVDKSEIYEKDYKECLYELKKENIKIDVAFIDPPYKDNLAVKSVEQILHFNLLNNNGIIILETDEKERELRELEKLQVKIYDLRKYGRVYLIFLSRKE